MFPKNPAKIIVDAQRIGMNALCDLMRVRVNSDTRHIYMRSKKRLDTALDLWDKSQQVTPNFTVVSREEKHLRSSELDFIWETTARYGNKERKRIKNEREGIVGSLNAMLNIFGAKLRDYFILMYPFPRPIEIGKRKTKTIWGYDGGTRIGLVPVAHGPDLAELDFADMIRSHGRELCRKSFVANLPSRNISTYALSLIRRLSTFTDFIYTEGHVGRKGFQRARNRYSKKKRPGPCADELLRNIIDEIDVMNTVDLGDTPAPSRTTHESKYTPTKQFFHDQVTELRNPSVNTPLHEVNRRSKWAGFLDTLLGGKKPKLRDKDSEHLYASVRNRARWEGINYHRLITNGLPQPYNLQSIIVEGDRFLEIGDDFLLVGEASFETPRGRGRADLILFKRVQLANPNRPETKEYHQPVGIFDIKTRIAFNWEIKNRKARSTKRHRSPTQRKQKYYANFIVRKRGLIDYEWNKAVTEIPRSSDAIQLDLYSKGLTRVYREITGDMSCDDIVKGIILVDIQQDIAVNRDVIFTMIKYLKNKDVIKKVQAGCDRLLIRGKHPVASRTSIVLVNPTEKELIPFQTQCVGLIEKPIFTPFRYSSETKKQHILYLSVSSGSKSGTTAAWIAKYWHGLQYLKELSHKSSNTSIVWLDLAGTLGNKELAWTRLRLNQQSSTIQDFFRTVNIVDVSSTVNEFLSKGEPFPEIDSLINGKKNDESNLLVVVSGWDWVEESTPQRAKPHLYELERILINEFNNSADSVLWFARPRVAEATSSKYHRRSVTPFRENSSHQYYVSDIIWNLPVKPYSSKHSTPILDDLRVIIEQKHDFIDTDLIEVPPLEEWSSRFWSRKGNRKTKSTNKSKRGRPVLLANKVVTSDSLKEELIQDSIELIPWIRDLWPRRFKLRNKAAPPLELDITATPLFGKPAKSSGIMSRMTYRPRPQKIRSGKSFVQSVTTKFPLVTHPRHYRTDLLKTKQNKQVYIACQEETLDLIKFRDITSQRIEIRRLTQVLKVLSKTTSHALESKSWKKFVSHLNSLIQQNSSHSELQVLNNVVEYLSSNEVSRSLWDTMSWIRERTLGRGLLWKTKETLENYMESRPFIVTTYGNYLYLLLLAITRNYPSLTINNLEMLWKTMKSWQLIQLGFRSSDGAPSRFSKPKFDARALWANLSKRAKILAKMVIHSQTNISFGQLVILHNEENVDFWLMLENEFDKQRLISGVWKMNPLIQTSTIKWAESNHRKITEAAVISSRQQEVTNLIITKVDDSKYIWAKEGEQWYVLGRYILIPRKRNAITGIRGFKVESIESQESLEFPRGATIPLDLSGRIQHEFHSISSLHERIIPVKCYLDIENGQYRVRFDHDGDDLDEYVTHQTADLIALLRLPLVDGIPLKSKSDPKDYFTWNPYTDIEYSELQLLKPYVERKSPFVHVDVPLPLTCDKLQSRPLRDISLTIVHDENLCPMVDNTAPLHGSCWRFELSEEDDVYDLAPLTEVGMSDQDITSFLSAGEVFFEEYRYNLSFEFENDPNSREGIVFRESKRIARELKLKSVSPGAYLHMDSEMWTWYASSQGGTFEIIMTSELTGERVDTVTIQIQNDQWEVPLMLERIHEIIQECIEHHFGEDTAEERILEFDRLLEKVEDILRNLKLGEIENLPNSDSDSLLMKLDFFRDLAERESIYEERLANILFELARHAQKEGDTSDALLYVEECIQIYKKIIDIWNEDSARYELKKAQRFERKIRKKS